MAIVATKAPYPTPVSGSPGQPTTHYLTNLSAYRSNTQKAESNHGFFSSPTESEFSESYEVPDSVKYKHSRKASCYCFTKLLHRSWDENGVGDWLRSINCAHYVDVFRSTLS